MIKKLCFFFILILFTLPLLAVHNFTINGETSITVSVSDSLHLEFDFESVGNSADFALNISILGQSIPVFSGNYLIFQDGGMMDQTGIDGTFSGGFNNIIQLPENAILEIELTDEDVSATVEVQFEQLDTDFSIAGNVLQEGGWIDLPVIGGLVWTLYNGSAEYLMELFENFDLEAFQEFITSDHYILSDLTGFLGDYQIMIPEDIPNVACAVGVFSMLDLEGGYVPPANQDVTVNGHVTGIDFMYYEADGDFYGIVIDEEGSPVSNAGFLMENPNSTMPYFFSSDSLGNFSISLLDGTYPYTVAAIGYETVTDSVTISGSDVYREITLESYGGIGGLFHGFVTNELEEPVINAEIMVIPINPTGNPVTHYSMGDGSFSFELSNGTYSYMITHSLYQGITGEFEITDDDVYMDIIMLPASGSSEDIINITDITCYPNPFNPTVTLSFYLVKPDMVNLSIYNYRGQKVNELLNQRLDSGAHSYLWQGTDQKGRKIASGVYYYHLSSGKTNTVGKMMLLK